MWTFQYKHGDRPLDGFTIQRAAGRGGFGEVYYAVSDSGREVALKVISGYEQIELRGISQCMNLKSPHLVTIFDVKQNPEGRWFVIMEFVTGANLRQLLDEAPAGLGTQKAAFFLREIAKGLTFLHECGIVHRDLKPANIFYENGYVKIGDYGLSKAIAPDQHSGQTVTVGTVHYMAPEIGAGKYDRSVDIYALGALLYEMITGTVPHIGSSATEVLMKHLSAEPDFSNIPEPFCKVVRKAMAKDPAQRYQSVQEMVEDVFGAEHIRQSVSVFSPADLSMIAEHAAKRVTGGATIGGSGGGGVATGSSAATRQAPGTRPDVWNRFANVFDRAFGSADSPFGAKDAAHDSADEQGRNRDGWNAAQASATSPSLAPNVDPLTGGQRRLLAALLSLAAAVVGGALGGSHVDVGGAVFFIFPCVWGLSLGALLACRRLLPAMYSESPFVRRLVIGLVAGGLSLILVLPFLGAVGSERATSWSRVEPYGEVYLEVLLATLISWILLPIERLVNSNRSQRVSIGMVIAGGVLAFVFAQMLGRLDAVATTAVTCSSAGLLMLQMLAPWNPREAMARRAERKALKADTARHNLRNRFSRIGWEAEKAVANATSGIRRGMSMPKAPPAPPMPAMPVMPAAPVMPAVFPPSSSLSQYWFRAVPSAARWTWGVLMVIFVALFVAMLVAMATMNSGGTAPAIVCAAGLFQVALFSLVRSQTKRFYGWWGYLIKPLLVLTCTTVCVLFLAMMGSMRMSGDGLVAAWFFFALSFMGGIVLLCVPGRYKLGTTPPPLPTTDSSPQPSAHLDWHNAPDGRSIQSRNASVFMALLASLFIIAMLLVGLVYAINVPSLIASGLLDPGLATHMQRDVFGTADWPITVQRLICGVVAVLALQAMTLLTLARRRRGLLHTLRGIFGIGAMFVSVLLFHGSFYSRIWTDLSSQRTLLPGQAIMLSVNQFSIGLCIFAATVFMTGLLIVAWPAAPISSSRQPRTGWKVAAAIFVGLFLLMAVLSFFFAIAMPSSNVQIRTTTPGQIIIPPQMTDPFQGEQPWQIEQQMQQQQFQLQQQFKIGATTRTTTGSGFGGTMKSSSSLRKAQNPMPPKKPTTAAAPTTVPSGVFSD